MRYLFTCIINDKRRFIQRQLRNARETVRGLNRQSSPGGLAGDKSRSTHYFDEGCEIFDLTLASVWQGVATLAPATTVVDHDGKVRCQRLRQRLAWPKIPVTKSAIDQDESRSLANLRVRDNGTVFGDNGVLRAACGYCFLLYVACGHLLLLYSACNSCTYSTRESQVIFIPCCMPISIATFNAAALVN